MDSTPYEYGFSNPTSNLDPSGYQPQGGLVGRILSKLGGKGSQSQPPASNSGTQANTPTSVVLHPSTPQLLSVQDAQEAVRPAIEALNDPETVKSLGLTEDEVAIAIEGANAFVEAAKEGQVFIDPANPAFADGSKTGAFTDPPTGDIYLPAKPTSGIESIESYVHEGLHYADWKRNKSLFKFAFRPDSENPKELTKAVTEQARYEVRGEIAGNVAVAAMTNDSALITRLRKNPLAPNAGTQLSDGIALNKTSAGEAYEWLVHIVSEYDTVSKEDFYREYIPYVRAEVNTPPSYPK